MLFFKVETKTFIFNVQQCDDLKVYFLVSAFYLL